MHGNKAGNAQPLSIFVELTRGCRGMRYQHIPPAIFWLGCLFHNWRNHKSHRA
ncbi:hypothetical protein DP63_3308 [Burkholderia pseudomallei MSHR5855]|nr:hypothetical protein DP63_3308 [Burkholderia pseudomallei MSHR5855]AIP41041.1 hypothetical protein DP65_860 [Burkholderia pseudomallei MSHR5848]